jgi:hypothetical protein
MDLRPSSSNLEELAWLSIRDGPPTCNSSVALRTGTGTQLLIGCSRSVWVVYAPRPEFQLEALDCACLPLKDMPTDEGIRITSMCAVPSDTSSFSPCVAISFARSDSLGSRGCGVHIYGGGLEAGSDIKDVSAHVQGIPLPIAPILVKCLAWKTSENSVRHALVVCGCGEDMPFVFVRKEPSSGSEFIELEEPLAILAEIDLLREIAPVLCMDVKYLGNQRHVVAGGAHGGYAIINIGVLCVCVCVCVCLCERVCVFPVRYCTTS